MPKQNLYIYVYIIQVSLTLYNNSTTSRPWYNLTDLISGVDESLHGGEQNAERPAADGDLRHGVDLAPHHLPVQPGQHGHQVGMTLVYIRTNMISWLVTYD